MIIAVCKDDPTDVEIAKAASKKYQATFGNWYKIYDKKIPNLGATENLFIIAHGASYTDEGQPVIGNMADAFYLTARNLNANMHLFPSGYSGGVYIYACESADHGAAEVSFVLAYLKCVKPSYPNIKVFGQTGKIHGPLPVPSDPSWKSATGPCLYQAIRHGSQQRPKFLLGGRLSSVPKWNYR